jgi:hypothetical protein
MEKREREKQSVKINCQEVCAMSCPSCKPHCIRECAVSKKSGDVDCKKAVAGCCQECKDDCKTVCDLGVES